jgi:hypothetical protein
VTLSRKEAKSRTRVGGLRSTGTKTRTRVGRIREPRAELEKKLVEALEQQAATSEVLRVISTSPGELEPVFKTILENATGICGAKFGTLWLRDGDGVRAAALYGAPPAWADQIAQKPVFRPSPHAPIARALEHRQTVQSLTCARSEPMPRAIRLWCTRLTSPASARCLECRC